MKNLIFDSYKLSSKSETNLFLTKIFSKSIKNKSSWGKALFVPFLNSFIKKDHWGSSFYLGDQYFAYGYTSYNRFPKDVALLRGIDYTKITYEQLVMLEEGIVFFIKDTPCLLHIDDWDLQPGEHHWEAKPPEVRQVFGIDSNRVLVKFGLNKNNWPLYKYSLGVLFAKGLKAVIVSPNLPVGILESYIPSYYTTQEYLRRY